MHVCAQLETVNIYHREASLSIIMIITKNLGKIRVILILCVPRCRFG